MHLTSEKNCLAKSRKASAEHVSFLLIKHSNAAAYA